MIKIFKAFMTMIFGMAIILTAVWILQYHTDDLVIFVVTGLFVTCSYVVGWFAIDLLKMIKEDRKTNHKPPLY